MNLKHFGRLLFIVLLPLTESVAEAQDQNFHDRFLSFDTKLLAQSIDSAELLADQVASILSQDSNEDEVRLRLETLLLHTFRTIGPQHKRGRYKATAFFAGAILTPVFLATQALVGGDPGSAIAFLGVTTFTLPSFYQSTKDDIDIDTSFRVITAFKRRLIHHGYRLSELTAYRTLLEGLQALYAEGYLFSRQRHICEILLSDLDVSQGLKMRVKEVPSDELLEAEIEVEELLRQPQITIK